MLVALLVVVSAVTLLTSASAWPLLAAPIMVSFALAGGTGLVISSATAAAVFGMIAGRPGASAAVLVVAWCAFVIASVTVGARHGKVQRDLARVAGASLRDRLTGLYNFAYFSDALRRECQRVTRYGGDLSLVLFDLDAFKSFNDTHGHEAGNRLLSEVGRVLESVRRSADVVARYGGEEFVLLVPGPPEAAAEAAERIRLAVSRVIVDVGRGQHDGRTISAGVASYRRGDPPEAVVEEADRALYLSKRRGRNRVSVSGESQITGNAVGF